MAQRFINQLLENSMIMRVGHSVGQEAGHFSVCNYETYNTPRNTKRDTERDTFKEVFKESKNNKIKDTPAFASAPASLPAEALAKAGRNLSAKQSIAARGEGAYFRKIEEVPVKD